MGKTRTPRAQAQTKKPRAQAQTKKPRAQARGNSGKKQTDERAGIVNAKPLITIEELQSHLPYAEQGELEGFLKQTTRLKALAAYFAEFSDDVKNAPLRMKNRNEAAKLLDYTRPYRIGLVSSAAAGKSSLVNAMLGRDLAIVDEGKAVTGSAVEFFQDADSEGDERVEVSFNDVSDICRLAKRGFADANFNVELPENISDTPVLIKALEEVTLPSGHGEASSDDFEKTKQTVTDIVRLYSSASIPKGPLELKIDEEESIRDHIVEPLKDAAEEEKSRIVGVKSVSYHLHRSDDSVDSVLLPPKVCLVDMPGIGGGSRHDFIFAEQLDELNAIVFVCQLGQRLPGEESPEAPTIRKFQAQMGDNKTKENVFLVVNKIDVAGHPDNPRLKGSYQDLVKLFYGDKPPQRSHGTSYFPTSAQGAIVAREAARESDSDRNSDDDYRTIALGLRRAIEGPDASEEAIPSPDQVTEWSGVPLLMESLTEFARQQYVKGRSDEAKKLIDSIVDGLQKRHQASLDKLPQSSKLKNGDIEALLDSQFEKVEEELATLAKSEGSDLPLDEISSAIHDATSTALDLLLGKHLSVDRAMPGGNSRRVLMQFRFQADVQKIIWDAAIQESTKLADWLADAFEMQFTSEAIRDNLVELGFNRPEAELTFSDEAIEKILQDMKVALRGVCERVAIAHLTDDDVVVTDQNFWEGFSNLLDVNNTKEQVSRSLQAFLAEAKKKYEAAIKDKSVPALLAVYKYERFRVQDACRSLADELFREYRRKFPDDEKLRNAIVSAFQSENEQEKVNQAKKARLEAKITALKKLAS